MITDDSMSDDVFETDDSKVKGLNVLANTSHRTPSPTGYKDYQPPKELFEPRVVVEEVAHKTILLGDSGVGKTSLLVQFDTGTFKGGNFAATVGIGFMKVPRRQSFTHIKWNKRSFHSNGTCTTKVIDDNPSLRKPFEASEAGCIVAKVMLLGDSGVGKTCLLIRFRDNQFLSGNFISTVGIDFRNKVVTVDDTKVKLQIWDTAGQERFRSVTHAYYRDAHALLLLYDVTNKTSFDNIRAWLGEIRDYAQEDVVIMLLGNKADCNSNRVVKKEDGERLAKEYDVAFMETSAKTGLNVELAFIAIAREIKSRKIKTSDETSFNVKEYVREQSQKSQCQLCNT